jgi:hypothetical protein
MPPPSPFSSCSTTSTPRHHSGQRSMSRIACQTGSQGESNTQVVKKR